MQTSALPAESRSNVVVIGSGNAGFCAALGAREAGASVLLLEKAPPEWVGGNSYFTAGAIRIPHGGLDDLRSVVDGLDSELAAVTDLPPYSEADFLADMRRVTQHRCDEELTAVLVAESADAIRWLHRKGLRFRLMYDRQSYQVDGRHRFWGGLVLGTVGGGQGLIASHLAAAQAAGVELRCGMAVTDLIRGAGGEIAGVRCEDPSGTRIDIPADAVVLASGGFEADAELRAAELGPEWTHAKVRGTPFNTGEVLQMALKAGAARYGQWNGCHAIAWDASAPPAGDRELTNRLSRQSYPIGLVVNRQGQRFVDEGADFRNYTYAKYGGEILKQPGAVAFQLFDQRTAPLLRRDDYEAPRASRAEATSIRQLAEKLGIDPEGLTRTVTRFNSAVEPGEFNPAIKDGKRTVDIDPPKSNWACALDCPPFIGFPVTCGITFTFGGLRIDREGCVLGSEGEPIRGLYAAGEIVGGLFHFNYPGGAGLAAGAVFGRRAGCAAARHGLGSSEPASRPRRATSLAIGSQVRSRE